MQPSAWRARERVSCVRRPFLSLRQHRSRPKSGQSLVKRSKAGAAYATNPTPHASRSTTRLVGPGSGVPRRPGSGCAAAMNGRDIVTAASRRPLDTAPRLAAGLKTNADDHAPISGSMLVLGCPPSVRRAGLAARSVRCLARAPRCLSCASGHLDCGSVIDLRTRVVSKATRSSRSMT
eukprot:3156465-Prymnesium_polylepis.1